ncbi:unnamed protein product [Penicillium egyptiacum]|uniref:tryptophan synthase n=1 Tax=Penicillium egyptiacum TaxID=1303716 RepID=A0A9W4P0Z8_9EURO|nr:unnamed protein product [Penicillium egyptiacum]
MQAGGADIIELGLPFTDPIADGPTIQKSNLKALENGVTISSTLDMVRDARQNGLKTPVLFMGYYNPIMRYGEPKLLADCKEAIRFHEGCTKTRLLHLSRLSHGVTGATGTLNSELPALIKRVKDFSENVSVPVGFGISTREHFLSVTSIADGAVIGNHAEKGRSGCLGSCGPAAPQASEASAPKSAVEEEAAATTGGSGLFGDFGCQYAPEALITCLDELNAGFEAAPNDPTFWAEFKL